MLDDQRLAKRSRRIKKENSLSQHQRRAGLPPLPQQINYSKYRYRLQGGYKDEKIYRIY